MCKIYMKGLRIIVGIILTIVSHLCYGVDDKEKFSYAMQYACDSFIKELNFSSLYADGAEGYTSSGAHAIYPDVDDSEVVDSSKEFSEDILSCYDIVAVLDDSPKKDSRGLQVLRDTNKEKNTFRTRIYNIA